MIELRRYQQTDAPALGQIFQSAILGSRQHYNQEQREEWAAIRRWSEGGWQKRMDGICPWVAIRGSDILGYADVQPSGLIDHFFVARSAHRQGVGRLLMSKLFEQATEMGLKELHSEVSRNAQFLYAKFGFSPSDIIRIESLGATPTTIAKMIKRAPFVLRAARTSADMAFSLEPAAAEDFEAVLALRIRAMKRSLERLGRFDPERARERLRDTFDPRFGTHIVQGGQRVGYLTVQPDDQDPSLKGQRIVHLYLESSVQRVGLGSAVLRQITQQADAQQEHLHVSVLDQSEALRFYLREGFACVTQSAFDWELHRPPAGFELP